MVDYTEVRLVAKSVPTIPGLETAEDFVAYAARVSNPSNQMNSETAPKLLRYLIKNKHWSPFEMVHLCMEIVTTRDIAHQIVRHRSFAFQEFSQRYANVNEMGFVTRETRLQDSKNRQNSVDTEDNELITVWEDKQTELLILAKEVYKWAISNNIAKEQARAALPEGLTKTKLYMSGSLRSWLHYCALRCGNGTQKEHKGVADKALDILEKEFPSITGLVSELST